MLELVLQGVLGCLSPFNLCVIVLSVSLGIIVGCLPGFGAATGLVLVLPMTYGMDPGTAFIALTGIYVGAEYGGSISAILINTPGTAAAVMTCLDGHTLASQGKARDALLVSNIASFSGGIIGGLTSGMPIIFRAAFKPTPSIGLPQRSVDLDSLEETRLEVRDRHDPCIAVRAVPCVEAAAAVTVLDMVLGK